MGVDLTVNAEADALQASGPASFQAAVHEAVHSHSLDFSGQQPQHLIFVQSLTAGCHQGLLQSAVLEQQLGCLISSQVVDTTCVAQLLTQLKETKRQQARRKRNLSPTRDGQQTWCS